MKNRAINIKFLLTVLTISFVFNVLALYEVVYRNYLEYRPYFSFINIENKKKNKEDIEDITRLLEFYDIPYRVTSKTKTQFETNEEVEITHVSVRAHHIKEVVNILIANNK